MGEVRELRTRFTQASNWRRRRFDRPTRDPPLAFARAAPRLDSRRV